MPIVKISTNTVGLPPIIKVAGKVYKTSKTK